MREFKCNWFYLLLLVIDELAVVLVMLPSELVLRDVVEGVSIAAV